MAVKLEVSVAKLTKAEKCTTGVFFKRLLFDLLANQDHGGTLSSCKCRMNKAKVTVTHVQSGDQAFDVAAIVTETI